MRCGFNHSHSCSLSCEQFGERFIEFIAHHLVVGDVDALEDGLVQDAPRGIASCRVEVLSVLEQTQVGIDECGARSQVVLDQVQLNRQLVSLPTEVVQSRADFRLGEASVGREVEKVLLLRIEGNELVFELLSQEPLGSFAVGQSALHARSNRGNELGGEADGRVVLFDGEFDAILVGIGGIAGVILRGDAEEVPVCVSLLADAVLNDHAFDSLIFEPATSAEQCALEVVVMGSSPLTGSPACVHDGLHGVKQFLADDGWVSTVVLLSFVLNFTKVVAVTQ